MNRAAHSIALLVAIVAAAPAAAATLVPPPSADVTITATVQEACTLNVDPAVALGSYDPTDAAALNKTHPLTIQCTKGQTAKLTLTGFTGALTNGGESLTYTLEDPDGGSWANGADWSIAATGAAQIVSFDVNVAPGQYVPAGDYSETITLTLDL